MIAGEKEREREIWVDSYRGGVYEGEAARVAEAGIYGGVVAILVYHVFEFQIKVATPQIEVSGDDGGCQQPRLGWGAAIAMEMPLAPIEKTPNFGASLVRGWWCLDCGRHPPQLGLLGTTKFVAALIGATVATDPTPPLSL
ncbi:hypothetical protein CRG98_037554 [Punica granatum]|uniref:Uncharacterized protein n=1 Tax=Punica granatum TaxID=22663 RepID=A0A2I0IDP7_PUNGR|nr:hypothetical protein CRG98_037554 [Punica granatum]